MIPFCVEIVELATAALLLATAMPFLKKSEKNRTPIFVDIIDEFRFFAKFSRMGRMQGVSS